METAVITKDMMIVFGLLGLAIFLFVSDLLRVDLVGLLMMVLLPLTGVLSAEQAIAGLSFQRGGVNNCGDDYWCRFEQNRSDECCRGTDH